MVPYLISIKYNNLVIVFSLAHDITINKSIDWKLAEFFIMPEFRKKNFGSEAAIKTIKSQHGSWEISVLEDNLVAKKFWLHILNKLSVQYKSFKYQQYEVVEVTI